MNKSNAEGAKESAKMDFSHADSVDSVLLNKILWKDRKGDIAMPKPVHHMCGQAEEPHAEASKDKKVGAADAP